MIREIKYLWDQLRSKETWERVRWLNRFKSWEEAPPSTPITKKDILPIIISTIIGILILVVGITIGLQVVRLFQTR